MNFTGKQFESLTIILRSTYAGVGLQTPTRAKLSFRAPHCTSWHNNSYIQHGGRNNHTECHTPLQSILA